LRLQYRPSDQPVSRIAFAISRDVGTAVARNRIRRRIRAILRELDLATGNLPPPGDLLIRVTAPLDGWSHAELRTTMIDLLLPWSPR
jgi:ribonuclease P protein component